MARLDVPPRRRPPRLRAGLPARVGAEPLVLAPCAPACRPAAVRIGAARTSATARAGRLGVRRKRHDERVGAAVDPVRAPVTGARLRRTRLRPIPRASHTPSASHARALPLALGGG